jgi:uncharacterized membrane protein
LPQFSFKLPKVNNCSMGGNLPNLVTLMRMYFVFIRTKWSFSRMDFFCERKPFLWVHYIYMYVCSQTYVKRDFFHWVHMNVWNIFGATATKKWLALISLLQLSMCSRMSYASRIRRFTFWHIFTCVPMHEGRHLEDMLTLPSYFDDTYVCMQNGSNWNTYKISSSQSYDSLIYNCNAGVVVCM